MNNSKTVSRIVIKSIAFGILLMAFFTLMWTGIAGAGLSGVGLWLVLAVAMFIICSFVGYAIHLLKISKKFPKAADDKNAEGKNLQKWYGIVFGLEGILIGVVCGTLGYLKLYEFIVPAIALIVGLHFYPMANVFKRKFDYLPATWATLIGIIGLILTCKTAASNEQISLFVGGGMAVATISYGIYMMFLAEKYKSELK